MWEWVGGRRVGVVMLTPGTGCGTGHLPRPSGTAFPPPTPGIHFLHSHSLHLHFNTIISHYSHFPMMNACPLYLLLMSCCIISQFLLHFVSIFVDIMHLYFQNLMPLSIFTCEHYSTFLYLHNECLLYGELFMKHDIHIHYKS